MGRQIRKTVPQTKGQLIPSWSYLPQFKQDNLQFKEKQKENFDKRHQVKEQFEIPDESEVITTEKQPAEAPRSYIVETPSGEVQRNRSQVNVVPEHSSTVEPEVGSSPTSAREQTCRIVTRSQTGTAIRPPERLFYRGRCSETEALYVCAVRLFTVHCYVTGMYYMNVCSCISQSVCQVCKSVC